MRFFGNSIWFDTRGQVALTFSGAAMGLAAVFTLAINSGTLAQQRHLMQNLVDETAMAMAVEISVISEDGVDLESIALSRLNPRWMAEGHPALTPDDIDVQTLRLAPLPVPVPPGGAPDDAVEISVETQLQGLLGTGARTFGASARAQRLGASNLCVIGLSLTAGNTIELNNAARLTAPNCDIVSNSSHAQGINAADASKIRANEIHSAGGTAGQALNFDPAPTTDSLTLDDPLLGYADPAVGACDVTASQPWSTTGLTLDPGVYCSGLRIDGGRDVILRPGVYTFLGDLEIVGSASLTGDGVTLHFAGGTSRLIARGNATLDLSAPTTGPTAGILLFEDRAQTGGLLHRIETPNARYMVGTIYIPKGTLKVDAAAPVSDQSEYTAILANRIRILGDSNLFLNTDYDATDVPTPFGVGPKDEGVRLAR